MLSFTEYIIDSGIVDSIVDMSLQLNCWHIIDITVYC